MKQEHGGPWQEFRAEVQNGTTKRLAVVLGSGIHEMWEPETPEEADAVSTLGSWSGLLHGIGLKTPYELRDPTMLWEAALLEMPLEKDASAEDRNRMLRRKVSKAVADAEKVLAHRLSTPQEPGGGGPLRAVRSVLESPAVTDVVSLNVDRTVERLLSEDGSVIHEVGDHDNPLARYATVDRPRPAASSVRVWYPHGFRDEPDSLSFGLRRYSRLVEGFEAERREVKRREREWREGRNEGTETPTAGADGGRIPESWLEALMFQPVLFAGVSLDPAEWDVWTALVLRWRNYARDDNRTYEPSAWVLSNGNSHAHLPQQRFTFLDAGGWDRSWSVLAKCLEAG